MKTQEMMGKITEKELNDFLIPSEQGELRLIERTQDDIDYEISVAGSTQFPESIDTLCKARNVITFEELLKRAEAYFRSINAEIEHVLVDEFQDVGSLEFNFIDSLQADNYFLVGDDWQSIYSFKGGNVKIFMKLIEDGLFSVYYLTNNYRNSRAVLEIADTIISQVYSKIDKTIVPMSQEEGSVQLLSKRTIPVVLDSIKKDGNFRDYFILVRTNKDLFKMQEICEENEVPFTTFKREGMSLADLKRHMDSNRVKILTVHVSKGLEVKNVLLYGNFPVKCPNYMKDEEERKVMYVAVTRAKENLVIMN
jgi:DNA helicase-2/ATP-dependent DNA helicase PcrA